LAALLLNWFWPYSDSLHVTVNSNVKHTPDVAMLDVAKHDVAMHYVAVHEVGMQSEVVHSMDVPGVGIQNVKFVSGKKLIFDAH
jgi:hypothetical protein